MIGTKLAHYEITSHLGSGGMGEVYQATDSKLGRSVAIKLLPEAFTHDHERASRFEREARVLASLNHPNIAAIYGIEESGGRKFLVMELVPGETLAAKISRGAIPVDETLGIAKEIAVGLEAAHEKGIIHRDLKPANVKLTPDGRVKILDFGLAKAFEPEIASASLSNSPTLSFAATQAGVILGTAAYMSPEQARAKSVDKRADIWSFGCVFYEMIAGRRPFEGPTVGDVLAAVIRAEPDWQALPSGTPAQVRQLLRRCLKKDPTQRLRDMGDARVALDEMMTATEAAEDPIADTAARNNGLLVRVLPWAATATLLLATVVLAQMYRQALHAPETAIVSEILQTKGGLDGGLVNITQPWLSPDGRRLAYLAPGPDGKSLLWVRSLDSTEEASPLKGTEGAYNPFWAPDGRRIGFFAGRKLMKIEVTGGPATEVSDVSIGAGGAWTPENFILFVPSNTSPIYRISANGGQSTPVTSLNTSRQEAGHSVPQLLPDNKHFLYYVVSSSPDFSGIYVGSLDGNDTKLILRGNSRTFFASPDYLLFVQDGALTARHFDMKRLEISGDPITIASPRRGDSVLGLTAARNGMLAYLSGQAQSTQQLQWFDRNSTPGEILADKNVFYTPKISPDGTEVAVAVVTSPTTRDIWTYDLVHRQPRRLTFDKFHNWTPVWSPKDYKGGRKLAFSTNPKGQFHIYVKSADGTGMEQALIEDDVTEVVDSWWGDYIAYARGDQKTTPVWDIWVLQPFGDRKPVPFLVSSSNKEEPTFSPDGKWMAYDADETGKGNWEVYVAPFPKGDGNWQISIGGGQQPRWRADGKELFYMAPGSILTAAEIQEKNGSIEVVKRHMLFPTNAAASSFRNYDVNADGSRFLIVMPSGQAGATVLTLVENWQALLQKK
jgi:Tol biopolymer transport system component